MGNRMPAGSVQRAMTARRFAAAGLAVAVVAAVAGCMGTHRAGPPASVPACQAGRLAVSLQGTDVHVVNPGPTACAPAGTYPVLMSVWRLDGPPPAPYRSRPPRPGVKACLVRAEY
jgi:hypothetical protein